MIQSPQTQSFGLWFGEDLTAGSETSDQAKSESACSLARPQAQFICKHGRDPPLPSASWDPSNGNVNSPHLTDSNLARPQCREAQAHRNAKCQLPRDLSALEQNNQTNQTQLS